MRFIAAVLLACASVSASAGTVYYVDLVNNDSSSIVALDVAPAGGARFQSVLPGNGPLRAGAATTVALRSAGAGCVRDLRIGFADGRVATKRGVDLCALRR